MKTLTTLATLVAASLAILPAAAQAQAPSRVVAVNYADLDLGSDAGRRTLEQRLTRAVNTACGEASPADLRGQNAVSACRAALHAEAAAQRDIALASRRGASTILAARR
jgi:UrcA family protein